MKALMEQVLEEQFGTDREEEFMKNLYDGCYDILFPSDKEWEWETEKAR